MENDTKDMSNITVMKLTHETQCNGLDIQPVRMLKVTQNGNEVVLSEKHLRIALKKWFSN